MFIPIFVLDSLCEPINNNILFQKLNFPAARMKVLELPWNQKVSPGIYIYYTLQELHEVLDLRNQREMFVIEFRVQPKKGWTVWNKTDLSFCQLDFPAGKMVSYSKFKECHLDLSSLKRSAAFLDKLEIDDLSLNYFFKTMVCCFIT